MGAAGTAGTGSGGGGQAGTGTAGSAPRGRPVLLGPPERVEPAGGAAAAAPGGGAAGTGGRDECQSDADCPTSGCSSPPCSELLCALGNDGFHHCRHARPPRSLCPEAGATGCCDSDGECTATSGGHCVPFYVNYCGGPAPLEIDGCRYDACTRDADCTTGARGCLHRRVPSRLPLRRVPDQRALHLGTGARRCVLATVGGIFCPGSRGGLLPLLERSRVSRRGDCPGRGLGSCPAWVPGPMARAPLPGRPPPPP